MVSIIIINYLQKELVDQCVTSIFETIKTYPFEVIVVNNSPSQSLSELTVKFPAVKIIDNENKGFSQANNLAASMSNGEYLLFLNGDTIFKNDFLKDMTDRASKIEFGVIGLKLLNEDGTFQLSFWKENNFINEIHNKNAEKEFIEKNKSYINKVENAHKVICEEDWVSGASLFIRKENFLKIGGFDERFFLYYEDAEICKRFKKAGYKIYYYPFSEIIHLKGINVDAFTFQSKTYYYAKDSQLYYYSKHASMLNRIILRIYLFVKFLFLSVITFKKINIKILGRIIGIS